MLLFSFKDVSCGVSRRLTVKTLFLYSSLFFFLCVRVSAFSPSVTRVTVTAVNCVLETQLKRNVEHWSDDKVRDATTMDS